MEKCDIEKMLTKASDNFVPNVLDRVMGSVSQQSISNTVASERDDNLHKLHKRKMVSRVVLAACVFLLCVFTSGHFYFSADDSFVYVDINPSVMLTLNVAGNVKSVTNNNADAVKLLANESLKGLSLEKAVERILQLAYEQKYIDSDSDDNVIAISILNKDLRKAEKQMENANKCANSYFQNNGIKCKVDKETGHKMDKDNGNGNGNGNNVSPKKLNIINAIIAIDPTYSVEVLEDYSVKELHKLLKKLEK